MSLRIIDAIAQRLAQPDSPVFNRGDWQAVESAIGTPLPKDYKEFISRYGAGWIEPARLGIISPFFTLPDRVEMESCLTRWESSGIQLPYSAYPAPDGLLQWGMTDSEEYFTWQVHGEPSGWPVVVLYDQCAKHMFDASASFGQILIDLIDGKSPLFDKDIFSRSSFSSSLRYRPIDVPGHHNQYRSYKPLPASADNHCYSIDEAIEVCIPHGWVAHPVLQHTSQYGHHRPYFVANTVENDKDELTASLVLLKNATPITTNDVADLRRLAAEKLRNDWEVFRRETQDSFNAWQAQNFLESSQPAEASETPNYGDRHLLIVGENTLQQGNTTIAKLMHSIYRDKWVCSYFWLHGGEWRLDCFLDSGDRDRFEMTADAIAQSVHFHNKH